MPSSFAPPIEHYHVIMAILSPDPEIFAAPVDPEVVAAPVDPEIVAASSRSHRFACDKTDDLIAGVKSTALLFGDKTKCWLSAFAVAALLGFGVTGALVHQTWPFYTALTAT
ncbi:unnamed protein product, partial [Gongylonema pulchrum]|uniref:Transmembrane protein n=1 Tax=Gongylonema pulchrum TaxID=637853 RepID=A0A183D8C3_9BILA